jgi:hypothetical protein
MRPILIIGLLALTGCASGPNVRTMEWNALLPHPDAFPPPAIENGQLTLVGGDVRSRNVYAAPLTVECELQSETPSAESDFFINLVPQDAPTKELAQDYLGIKLRADKTTLEIWAAHGGQPAHLIKSMSVPVAQEGHYKLVVEVQRGNFTVSANTVTLNVHESLPFDRFQVELRTFPPPSRWRVINFAIR